VVLYDDNKLFPRIVYFSLSALDSHEAACGRCVAAYLNRLLSHCQCDFLPSLSCSLSWNISASKCH